MILDSTPKGSGAFHVMADVRGSYGEIVHTQVGRNFVSMQGAIDWAMEKAKRYGWTGVRVVNRSTRWQFTVVA
jgi:hypothetical protein